MPECFVFDVVRNARRAAAGAPCLPRSTQPDPLLALDAEHREALAVFKAIGSGNPELEAVGDLQTELVDKLVNTPATSLEGVLVKLRYVLDYVDAKRPGDAPLTMLSQPSSWRLKFHLWAARSGDASHEP